MQITANCSKCFDFIHAALQSTEETQTGKLKNMAKQAAES